jgi:hypothetical protein
VVSLHPGRGRADPRLQRPPPRRNGKAKVTPQASGLELRALLTRVSEIWGAFIPHALTEPARVAISAVIRAGSFEPLPEQTEHHGVREQAELIQIPLGDTSRYPTITKLRVNITSSSPAWQRHRRSR